MFDVPNLTLMACVALLVLAASAIVAARSARGDCARLRAEAEAGQRELEQARTQVEVAWATGDGQARLVADRDDRIKEVLAELAGLRTSHKEAEARCADAEMRCASVTEAVKRLEMVERKLREDVDRHATLHREEQALHARLRADHAALRADTDGKLLSSQREVLALKELRAEMTREFQALAHQTLKDTGTQFSATHTEKLTELLTPFKEQVGRFEVELREVHQSAGRDRVVLHEQIRALTTQTQAVSQEAVNLTRALKGEKQRQGAWGENRLLRYLEAMGYVEGVDFEPQASRVDADGDRWRPDVILKLPRGKCLVIDSKVSLVAYAAATGAETEEERARHLRQHLRDVKAHIDTLAAKGYQALEQGSVDWVMLFMPIEGAVSAAWAQEGDLAAYAMERRIGIAYPTTLLMALKVVKQLWEIENRNANAEKIAQRGGLIYDKLAGFIESFGVMGRALDGAKAAQIKALGQLSEGKGNLVSQVEQLKRLGAKTSKSLALAFDAETETEGDETVLDVTPAPRALPAAE